MSCSHLCPWRSHLGAWSGLGLAQEATWAHAEAQKMSESGLHLKEEADFLRHAAFETARGLYEAGKWHLVPTEPRLSTRQLRVRPQPAAHAYIQLDLNKSWCSFERVD